MMETVSIIGLGLVGSSLGLALKKYVPGMKVKGYSRRGETVRLALRKGVIDAEASSLKEAVGGAHLVVIATPVLATKTILQEIAPHVTLKCIVSDVGSTKVRVMEWAKEYLPGNASFVGGHPMAGKEQSGIEAADPDLFRNAVYCLTTATRADKGDVTYLEKLIREIGATPMVIDAEVHDRYVAAVSHLQFLLAEAVMATCTHDPSWAGMAKLASSGFRDTTRLASGDPLMYRDICATNSSEILNRIDDFVKELQRIRSLVGRDPEKLEKLFKELRLARENWLKGR